MLHVKHCGKRWCEAPAQKGGRPPGAGPARPGPAPHRTLVERSSCPPHGGTGPPWTSPPRSIQGRPTSPARVFDREKKLGSGEEAPKQEARAAKTRRGGTRARLCGMKVLASPRQNQNTTELWSRGREADVKHQVPCGKRSGQRPGSNMSVSEEEWAVRTGCPPPKKRPDQKGRVKRRREGHRLRFLN